MTDVSDANVSKKVYLRKRKVDRFMKRTCTTTVAFLILLIFFLCGGAPTSRAADPKAADPATHEMNSRLPEGLPDYREEDE